MARQSMSRSESSSSTLSCITCVLTDGESPGGFAADTSATPPTSNTDAASVSSSIILDPKKSIEGKRRVQRVRTNISSYNESILSGSVKRAPSKQNADASSRTASGETLVPEDESMQRRLVRNSIQVLSLDWKVDSMTGDEIQGSRMPTEALRRRHPTRLKVLKKASKVVEMTKSVLGKRGRASTEEGKKRLQGLSHRASLRPRRKLQDALPEGPTQKRVKVSDEALAKEDSSKNDQRRPVLQPRFKHWLSQGLYVGQERDFDPRLTESKNKVKRAATARRLCPQRSILPLPMFAGERTIETGRTFRLPFDIFSPLPPGQPKPEEWRKTQKSKLCCTP